MLGSIYSFLKRNSTKIIISGFAISGALVLFRCVKNVLLQEEFYKLQLVNKYRANSMFDSYQNLSKKAVNKMLIPLKKIIYSMINLEEKLQLAASLDSKEKLILWEDMKILSFARLLLSIYSYCILLTIVELNFSNLTCKSQPNDSVSNVKNIENYNYESINTFFADGIKTLYNNIQSSTRNIVSPINLKEKFNKDDLIGLMFKIKNEIEINDLQYQLDVSLNHKSKLEYNFTYSRNESNDFNTFLEAQLTATFEKLDRVLEEEFKAKETTDGRIVVLPMAKIIPLVSNLNENVVFKQF